MPALHLEGQSVPLLSTEPPDSEGQNLTDAVLMGTKSKKGLEFRVNGKKSGSLEAIRLEIWPAFGSPLPGGGTRYGIEKGSERTQPHFL